MNKNFLVGCIGCGMMGSALSKAISKKIDGKNILLFDANIEKANELAIQLGAEVATSNEQIIRDCTHIIFAVKPAFFTSLLDEIKNAFNQRLALAKEKKASMPVCISILAGLNIAKIHQLSLENGITEGLSNIIRLMPNLPATVGESMIALCSDDSVSEDDKFYFEQVSIVKEMLSCAGKVEQVPEKLMDCVTAISGSGPAYGFVFIEALADAAVSFGMPRNQAYIYAAQTLKGAAQMVLETKQHPAQLKDAVCSPAGTTIDAVATLEEKGFRDAVISAAKSAYKKSIDLGK